MSEVGHRKKNHDDVSESQSTTQWAQRAVQFRMTWDHMAPCHRHAADHAEHPLMIENLWMAFMPEGSGRDIQ